MLGTIVAGVDGSEVLATPFLMLIADLDKADLADHAQREGCCVG